MKTRVKIKTESGTEVHFDTHLNNYTLCGLETGSDPSIGILTSAKITKQKVNCQDCIRIVKFCHNISATEFKSK